MNGLETCIDSQSLAPSRGRGAAPTARRVRGSAPRLSCSSRRRRLPQGVDRRRRRRRAASLHRHPPVAVCNRCKCTTSSR